MCPWTVLMLHLDGESMSLCCDIWSWRAGAFRTRTACVWPRVVAVHRQQVDTQRSSVRPNINIHTHTHKRTSLLLNVQTSVFMAPLQRNSDLICTAVMSPFASTVHGLSFLFSFFSYSFQISTNPLLGARTTCTQGLLPSGMKKQNKNRSTWQCHICVNLYLRKNRNIFYISLCVTVKEQRVSMSSTGVNSLPRTMSPQQSGRPTPRGCSGGFQAPTKYRGTVAMSIATTWSRMKTCSTYWVDAHTLCFLSSHSMHSDYLFLFFI